MNQSQDIAELVKALIEAEKNFEQITLNKSGQAGQGKFKYADLAEVFNKTKPALKEQGLKVMGTLYTEDGKNILSLKLFHISGQWISSSITLPPSAKPTEMGAILTYMRRYLYSILLGITAEEDVEGDDLNSTAQSEKPSSKLMSDTEILKLVIQLIQTGEFENSDRLGQYLLKARKRLSDLPDPFESCMSPAFINGYKTWLVNNPVPS